MEEESHAEARMYAEKKSLGARLAAPKELRRELGLR